MIPKIIHYCWFGGKEKPSKVKKCIDSWHRFLPDYKFMEWNENNFDIHSSKYVEQAYNNGKFAFVSDVARISALKQYGGIYFDTDVVVFKSFDDLILDKSKRCILGFEYDNWIATSFMACEKEHPLLDVFENEYLNEKFQKDDGSQNTVTNVIRLTNILEKKGLIRDNSRQKLTDNIEIYPIEYFSPYDYADCIMEKTENSYCAHLFFVSWLPFSQQIKKYIKTFFAKIIGRKGMEKIRNNKK